MLDWMQEFYDSSRVASDVPNGLQFDAWRLRVLSVDEFRAFGEETNVRLVSERQLYYLAAFNSLAPTTHNTVPQRFIVRPKESALEIWLDRTAVLPASDRHGRQALISIGCGVSNTVLAARCYGLDTQVEVVDVPVAQVCPHRSDEPRYTLIAKLFFSQTDAAPASLEWLDAMLRRKMVRAHYDSRIKLEESLCNEMHQLVKTEYPDIELHLVTDAPTMLVLGKFQELADTTVLNRDDFSLELGDWLLQNESTSFVGMRGAEYGLSDKIAQHIHAGLCRQVSLLPDEVAGFAKGGGLGIRSSSAVCVLTTTKDDTLQRLAAGRAFEDIALMLVRKGFVVAMHAGVTEVEAPNLALRGRLRTRARPTVLFRVGVPSNVADGQRPHAARPPLDRLVLDRTIPYT